jgi:hypothetical protein
VQTVASTAEWLLAPPAPPPVDVPPGWRLTRSHWANDSAGEYVLFAV